MENKPNHSNPSQVPNSSSPSILLLACGDLGMALAGKLLQAGWSVTGLRRTPPSTSDIGAQSLPGMRWLGADLTNWQAEGLIEAYDYIVYTPSPSGRTLEAYEALYGNVLNRLLPLLKTSQANASEKLKLWLQISSTSVYGQNAGEWVDELSPTAPERPSAQWICRAEQQLQDTLQSRACILRFSGIYGQRRHYLLRRVVRGDVLRAQHFTNRIHQADCVGLMAATLLSHAQGGALAPVYVGTDKTPVSEWHIGAWLANRMKLPVPPRSEDKHLTGKRCQSRYTDNLPYAFKYPTYELGYGAQIEGLMTDSSDWLAPLR